MENKSNYIVIIILVIIGSFFVWQQFIRDDFKLPKSGETKTEVITIEDNVIATNDSNADSDTSMKSNDNKEDIKNVLQTQKEIMITNGTRHSVPLDEILSGGPPKDGIPSIDNPKFISISEAEEWLNNDDPGIAFSRDTVDRFYPYQILVWHEIVNDTIDGKRILVTYCPLCLTGFVIDPIVKGERVEFGTSGKLWKSNLVMYDRKTDSLWSQVLAEAIVGEMTGTMLPILPSDQVRFRDWKKKFPRGEVLSRDTGEKRFYGSSPYGDYFSVTNLSLSLAKPTDTRLPHDAFVFGITINGKAKAYNTATVKSKGEITDTFQGETIVLQYDKDLDVVRMFKKLVDGSLERINPVSGFWFSWAAARPETELYE